MTRERAIHELSRSEYDVVCLLMLTTKFDNTRWPWRRAVATSVVGVAADIVTVSKIKCSRYSARQGGWDTGSKNVCNEHF